MTHPRLCISHILLSIFLALEIAGCASHPSKILEPLTFYVVRHAEKASSDSKDPPLSQIGTARARKLSHSIGQQTVQAVYATAYQRTQQTALPTAQAHSISVTTYDASQPSVIFVSQLKRSHSTGAILIVGHSNTASEIVSALCNCEAPAMHDDEYDRLYVVRIEANGHVDLELTRY